jgi:isocitrate dehydrogenase
MNAKTKITVAHGDGIGPEIMEATLKVLEAAGARLDIETIEIGEKVYESGEKTGMSADCWDSLRRTKVFLKAPITTPQGGGFTSLNVTTRKTLGLFANVRPCQAYAPFVETHFPEMDMVIVRENEEDLYAGIEHQQTDEVVQCLKLISRPGCERIVRYAFEYAKTYGRKKVTCMSKDNIMKMADGMFHRVFEEVASEYPDIEADHWIIDIGSALIADKPEQFDVIVTLNLYGDIISDIAAQVAGSVGMGGSCNIGDHCAMFEAIHGSAPQIAGKNIANPSGLIQAACMMLVHIGQADVAEKVQNAWLKTIEDGVHTGDIYKEDLSTSIVGTQGFADAVIGRLGEIPVKFKPVNYSQASKQKMCRISFSRPSLKKELVGVDVFLDWQKGSAQTVGDQVSKLSNEKLKLSVITNRGVKVYPDGHPETFCSDHWRCRFRGESLGADDILNLLKSFADQGLDVIKTENLYTFDGKPGFSKGQGE